ncbi:MAG: hypothetical protein VB140_08230 [Burkholderia sp.]
MRVNVHGSRSIYATTPSVKVRYRVRNWMAYIDPQFVIVKLDNRPSCLVFPCSSHAGRLSNFTITNCGSIECPTPYPCAVARVCAAVR